MELMITLLAPVSGFAGGFKAVEGAWLTPVFPAWIRCRTKVSESPYPPGNVSASLKVRIRLLLSLNSAKKLRDSSYARINPLIPCPCNWPLTEYAMPSALIVPAMAPFDAWDNSNMIVSPSS